MRIANFTSNVRHSIDKRDSKEIVRASKDATSTSINKPKRHHKIENGKKISYLYEMKNKIDYNTHECTMKLNTWNTKDLR